MYKPDYSSLLHYLVDGSKQWPNYEAFVIRRRIKKEIVRYKDLPNLVSKFEAWFSYEKIAPKSKMLFWGLNCPEYALSLLSCISTNRVAVPIDWRNSIETIQGVIKKTKPKFAFVSKYFRHEFLTNQRIKVFFIEDLFSLINNNSGKTKTAQKLLNVKDYTNPTNLVEIVFTSGTTGKPKGVAMKQKNLLANLKAVEPCLPNLNNSRTISILPLSHMLEQVAGLLLPIGRGTTIFYLPRINSFRLLQAFAEYKPTHLVFVPQLLKIFWEKIEDKARSSNQLKKLKLFLNLSSHLPMSARKLIFSKIHKLFGGQLVFVACGGAPLDKKVGENWMRVGIPVVEGYGATEATAVTTINNLSSPKLGSVGKPIPGVKVHLDENGEIYIDGESLTDGYYNDADRTKATFTPNGYKTGDIGEFDNEGNLHIKGRDVFKIVLPSGEKVFVEDLETKIIDDPRVKEACVVAKKLPDGDKIHAFLILKRGINIELKTVVTDINSHLESKQQITSFELWPAEDFPRTPTLKIDRKSVYEVANQQKAISDAVSNNTDAVYTYQNVVDIAAKVSGIDRSRIIDTDTLAGNLSIDSLSRVELVALAEEHLGLIIDEAKITAKTTIADLKLLAKSSDSQEDVALPAWQFTKWGEWIHYLATRYFLILLHSLIIKIQYPQKRLPTIQPGSVIIFNHPGIMDGVCVARALFKQNLTNFVTNSDANFWTNKTQFARPLELFVGGIPLYESGHKLMKVLQVDSDLLDRGYSLLFAPQGGLQTSDEDEPFKLGIGYIVQQLNRPVHIIKIEGYRQIWPVPSKGFENCTLLDFFPPRTGTVKVKISPMVKYDWNSMTPIQITNLLEEKYRNL